MIDLEKKNDDAVHPAWTEFKRLSRVLMQLRAQSPDDLSVMFENFRDVVQENSGDFSPEARKILNYSADSITLSKFEYYTTIAMRDIMESKNAQVSLLSQAAKE